jgi:LysM repeat protein
MKTIRLSPALIVVLAVLLVLAAACNRPDPQQALETPLPMNVPQQPVGGVTVVPQAQSVEATPTLNISSGGAVDLSAGTPAPGATQENAPAVQGTPQVPGPEVAGTQAPVAPTVQPTAMPTAQPAPATGGNQSYTVKTGDTLFSIGRLYSVNPYAIAAANNIPYPYIIYPGQQLIIPTGGTTPPGPTPIPPQPGVCRYNHIVRLGENLFRISLAYGVPMSTIAAANGISNYNLIYAGQTLCIP